MKNERIQKVLANLGIASRRKIEAMILDGQITVNDVVAVLGQTVNATNKIKIDGELIKLNTENVEQKRLILYHKPENLICTRDDPEGRPTVFEDLPPLETGRWISVGRLDLNTSGLLLFTNDGELANRLMHPSAEIEREYAVRVNGHVTREVIDRLLDGVRLEDGMAHFETVVEGGGFRANRWFYVTVREGRNRLVRRLWESQNYQVSRLKRIRFGNVELPKDLPRSAWIELDLDAV